MQHSLHIRERLSPMAQLRRDWQVSFGSPPPPDLGRALLARALSWKEQERIHGGFSPGVRRELERLSKQLQRSGELDLERQLVLKTGTRLERDWNGRTIHVEVANDGFIHEGQKYGSLSHVARAITGTRWSGPRFFGLAQRIRSSSTNA
jgi:hypothetical protein